MVESRSFPIPGGEQNTDRPDSNDVFGRNDSLALVQTFLFGASLIKGSTAYKPPDVEWRVILAVQGNYVDVPERRVLDVRPSVGSNRFDYALGVQEAFLDYHFVNTSYRYDFYSIRVGIQPFNLDFRGFLFQDSNLGFRLFGNRDNNRWQFNAGRDLAAREGHQFRPQQHPPDAAPGLGPARQCLSPGFPGRRPDQRVEPDLEHQPRAQRYRGRR